MTTLGCSDPGNSLEKASMPLRLNEPVSLWVRGAYESGLEGKVGYDEDIYTDSAVTGGSLNATETYSRWSFRQSEICTGEGQTLPHPSDNATPTLVKTLNPNCITRD